MRVKTIILFLFISLTLQAAKHYVATGGGGLGTLVSPFATLTQVNAHTFVAGDSLLFNKGDTFYGTLTMDASGTAGNPIYIGSYGTGATPIITGFSTLASWTNNGDGRYWATVTGAEAQTNMVTVDGVNTAMGRYPDAGTNLTYEFASGGNQITDTGIGDTPDWAGADIVIEKDYFILERNIIDDHTGDVFTFSPYGRTQYAASYPTRYYFIQNDLRCVTSGNEWYHDYAAGRLYIYGDPSAKVVKIATINKLIDLGNYYDYITIDGLKLSGSIGNALNVGDDRNQFGTGNNIIIKNCEVEFSGFIGISVVATQDYITIDNNTISNCNADGIFINSGTGSIGSSSVTNNDISYCGMIPGACHRGTDNQGIIMYGGAGDVQLIEYNNISYVGYNGIGVYSDLHADIKHNYVNYAMQVTDDGGGIYWGANSTYRPSYIRNNIVLNTAIGNVNAEIARGIYTDHESDNSTILNNVVYNSQLTGIFIHDGSYHRIENNLVYNNPQGIAFQKRNSEIIEYDTVRYNQVIARLSTEYVFATSYYPTSEIVNFGLFDYNYYSRPIAETDIIYNNDPDPGVLTHTLAAWKTLSGLETNTVSSPTAIDNDNQLHFIYNATQESMYWDLSAPMIDVTGADYSGQVALLPYTGLVLIGNGTVTEHVFGGSGTTFAKDADGNFIKDTNGNFIKIIQ
jgi:parallel beta-helix repeat protein